MLPQLATTEVPRDECADAALLDHVYELVSAGHVEEGLAELFPALHARRLELCDEAWDELARMCLQHPLRQLLHEDPFTSRAFSKPRGYAGDALLLDYIYGQEEGWPVPEASEVGKRVFAWTTGAPASEAV